MTAAAALCAAACLYLVLMGAALALIAHAGRDDKQEGQK